MSVPAGLDERPSALSFASSEAILKRSDLQAKRSLSEALGFSGLFSE